MFQLSERSFPEEFSPLEEAAKKATQRFPRLFDSRLQKGIERLIANTPHDFLTTRSPTHLHMLLLTQFFLQKKMERALNQGRTKNKPLFLKLFRSSSSICVALTFPLSYGFHREQLLKIIHTLLPDIHEVPRSSYLWHHPELPYLFCYLEIHKLRGGDLSKEELRTVEYALKEHLLAIPPLTPALFWPYNEEESYRQIQLMQKEMSSEKDYPHISIHFQEQSFSSLEFLIHLIRPKSKEPLEHALKHLPHFLNFYCHSYRVHEIPFPIEMVTFSLKVPSSAFEVRDSINLLYARRYVLKYLEKAIGPLRDYNGGLFEKQQQLFEAIRVHLGAKIPHFDLFAEKVFYALHPVELRLSLSLDRAEILFTAFSKLMQGEKRFIRLQDIIVVRTTNSADLLKFSRTTSKETIFHAQLTFGGFHYLCLLNPKFVQIKSLLKERSVCQKNIRILHLIFQEGRPISLNPYHSSGDMRSRVLSKLLFEGLMRLDKEGKPQLAGALQHHCSHEGILHTFKLRPQRFSNGESVTAIDYVTSWQAALSDHVSHPELLFVIKNGQKFREKKCHSKKLGVRAIDAETLEVELEWPDPYFLDKLTQPSFFPLFGSMQEPKWFNGPYLVREQNRDKLLLERNPYFWDTKRSFFEQIDIRWQEDAAAICALFQKGKVDWIGDPLIPVSSQFADFPSYDANNPLLAMMEKREVHRRFFLCFNTKHPVLKSQLVRKALSLCIDRSLICNSLFPHCRPLFPFTPSEEEACFLFEKGLKELGLTRDTFPSLTFIYSHQSGRELLALILQAAWQKTLNIKVHIEKTTWNLFRNKLDKRSFEISGTIQDTLDHDPIAFLDRLEGANSWNFSQWQHPHYRMLITSAKKEREEKKQSELIALAKNIVAEEVPSFPLFDYTHLYAHNPSLNGYLLDRTGCVDFSQAYNDTTIIG